LNNCFAVIVLIDHHWLNAFEQKRNGLDGMDYVLFEIEQALERRKLVIAAALHDVDIDAARNRLPREIESLGKLQWARIRHDPDFATDMQRVVQSIWKEIEKSGPSDRGQSRLQPTPPERPSWTALFSGVVRGWRGLVP
jgi:hypothetical protein